MPVSNPDCSPFTIHSAETQPQLQTALGCSCDRSESLNPLLQDFRVAGGGVRILSRAASAPLRACAPAPLLPKALEHYSKVAGLPKTRLGSYWFTGYSEL